MGTTAAQKKLFFNLRKAKSEIGALRGRRPASRAGAPDRHQLGVLDEEVISMNRRLAGGDASLNAPLRVDGDGSEWQDWLVDDDAAARRPCSPRATRRSRSA